MQNPKSLLFPLLLVLYEIGAYLSNDMYLPAFPQIATDLQITSQQAQFTLTTWFLGSVSLQLLLGPLSDRYGRKPMLILSGITYVISLLMCALTSDYTTLLIMRFIQGMTVSAAIVAGYASIHEQYDQSHAIRLLALMGSITIIAPAFGPLLGSFILFYADWRWIFGSLVIWSVIVTILLFIWMPETNPRENRQPMQLKSLAKNYFGIFTNWQFTGFCFIFCLTFCGFIAWLNAGPLLVIERFNYSGFVFGVAQAVIFACYIIANRLVKYLMETLGISKLIRVGLMITLIGAVLAVTFGLLLPNSLIALIIAMTIYSFGCGFSFAPLNRIAVEASSEPMGIRMAVLTTYMSAFGTLGSALIGIFYNATTVSLAYILFASAILAWIVKLSVGKPQQECGPASAHSQ